MNENYLWDKTGNDPEIEKLENALQIFRCAEMRAPDFPAKTILPQTKNYWNIFRRGAAFAACAVLIAAGAFVWNQVLNNLKTETAKVDGVQNSAPLVEKTFVETPTAPNAGSEKVSPVKAVEISRQMRKPQIIKEQKIFAPVSLKTEKAATKSAPVDATAKLTGEEKYAYDQLMLALSITSEKLKIVKDKVNYRDKSDFDGKNEK